MSIFAEFIFEHKYGGLMFMYVVHNSYFAGKGVPAGKVREGKREILEKGGGQSSLSGLLWW